MRKISVLISPYKVMDEALDAVVQYVISESVSLTHVLKYTAGSFTKGDGDGSENVLVKINSRFFKRRRDYYNSL